MRSSGSGLQRTAGRRRGRLSDSLEGSGSRLWGLRLSVGGLLGGSSGWLCGTTRKRFAFGRCGSRFSPFMLLVDVTSMICIMSTSNLSLQVSSTQSLNVLVILQYVLKVHLKLSQVIQDVRGFLVTTSVSIPVSLVLKQVLYCSQANAAIIAVYLSLNFVSSDYLAFVVTSKTKVGLYS